MKKTLKRALTLLLSLLLLSATMSAGLTVHAAGASSFRYYSYGNLAMIYQYIGPATDAVEIPDTIDGYQVLYWSPSTFAGMHGIELVLQDSFPSAALSVFREDFEEGISDEEMLAMVCGELLGDAGNVGAYTVSENNPYLLSVDGVLYSKDGSTLLKYPTGSDNSIYVLPEAVKLDAAVQWGSYPFTTLTEDMSNYVQIPLTVHLSEKHMDELYAEALKYTDESEDVIDVMSSMFTQSPLFGGVSKVCTDWNGSVSTELISRLHTLFTQNTTFAEVDDDFAALPIPDFEACSGEHAGAEPTKKLRSISLTSWPDKLIYQVGEELDATGLELTALYSDSSTETVTEGFTLSGYDAQTEGTQSITVTYGGKTEVFSVSVFADVSHVNYDGNYQYSIRDGYAVILRFAKPVNGKIVVPDTLGGHPVVMWDEGALLGYSDFELVLPDSLPARYVDAAVEKGWYDDDLYVQHGYTTAESAAVATWFYGSFLFCSANAFTVSDANPYLKSVDGVLYSKDMDMLIKYPAFKQASYYEMPDTIDLYGTADFFWCGVEEFANPFVTLSRYDDSSICYLDLEVFIPATVLEKYFKDYAHDSSLSPEEAPYYTAVQFTDAFVIGTSVVSTDWKSPTFSAWGGTYDFVSFLHMYFVYIGISPDLDWRIPDFVYRHDTHTPGKAVVENSNVTDCAVGGTYEKVVYCTVCGEEISRETVTVSPGDHLFGDWTFDPDNSETSYVHTCTLCGFSASWKPKQPAETVLENTFDGVRIEGNAEAFEEGTTLQTQHISLSDQETGEVWEGWNVWLVKDGEHVQPKEPIVLKLRCPAWANMNELQLWHYENGSWHRMPSWIEGNYICCITDSLSPFAFRQGEDEPEHVPAEAVRENEVKATCTQKGTYDEVIYCQDCGIEIKRSTIEAPALGHSFTNYVYNNDATAEADGTKTAKCDRCDTTDTISAPGTRLASPTVKIRNYSAAKTIDYRASITFTAVVEDAVTDAQVHWFVNGKDVGTGETYTNKNVKKSFTVQAKYMKGTEVLTESETQTVNVKTGLFARILAFFRWIFGRLPKIVQGYLST